MLFGIRPTALAVAMPALLAGCSDALLYPKVAPEENLAAAPPAPDLVAKAAAVRARLLQPFFMADARDHRDFQSAYGFFQRSQFHRAMAVSEAGRVSAATGDAPTAAIARDRALEVCNSRARARGRLEDCVLVAEDDAVLRGWRDDPARARAEAAATRIRYAVGPFVYENDKDNDRSRNGTVFWGPQAAKGVIVFSHGYGGNCTTNIADRIHPFVYKLNLAGWDVLRFDRDPCWEGNHPAIYHQYNERLPLLKAAGYRRLVLTGQSAGGSMALGLLTWSNAGQIDGVIDVVGGIPLPPDSTYLLHLNPDEDEGQDHRLEQFKLTVDRISTRVPVVIIDFPDDPFFRRAKDGLDYAENYFSTADIPHLIIYPKTKYTGHFAAGTVPFADDFQDCIQAFIERAQPATACPTL